MCRVPVGNVCLLSFVFVFCKEPVSFSAFDFVLSVHPTHKCFDLIILQLINVGFSLCFFCFFFSYDVLFDPF